MSEPLTAASPDRCASGYESELDLFDRKALAECPESVIGIDEEFNIFYLNHAWDAFADKNGGGESIRESWGLGSNYLKALATPVRSFYRRLFETAAASSEQRPVQHSYECSSRQLFRKFRMSVYRLPESRSVMIVNSLVIERPHGAGIAENAASLPLSDYTDGSGMIRQCCHCRRVRRPVADAVWDWIPQWVEGAPDNTSHSLCEVCFRAYYSDLSLSA
ncbi:MAG: hypothetical protein ACI9R3_002861 [Verrucomicrobiales bacterium]